jgi:hypothetical protein
MDIKINEINPLRRPGNVRRKNLDSENGDFGALIEETGFSASEPAAPVSGMIGSSPIGNLDIFLQMQQVDDQEDKEHLDRGYNMLDDLEELRKGLMLGAIHPGTIRRMTNSLTKQYGMPTDPRLKEILSEIETRAAVELAKLEREE